MVDSRRPLLSSAEWMAPRTSPPPPHPFSSRWPARASGTLARATRSFPRPRYRCINASRRTRAHARDLPRARVSSRIQIERANTNEYERLASLEHERFKQIVISVYSRLLLSGFVSRVPGNLKKITGNNASITSRFDNHLWIIHRTCSSCCSIIINCS